MDPILLQQQPQNTPISIDNRSHKSGSQNIPTNVIEHSGPSSPRYVSLEARVSSFRDQFKSWPPGLKQKPEELAEAGFFYLGLNDCVQCPVCDLLQSSWAPGDDPWIRHAANSPACAFLVEEKGSDWIRDVYNEHCES